MRPELRIQSGLFMKEAHGRPPQPIYEKGVQPPSRGRLQLANVRLSAAQAQGRLILRQKTTFPSNMPSGRNRAKKGKGP